MATTYFRLQIYFILSVVIAYIAFLGVWFNVDDRIVKNQSEKDFREVIQMRNQVRDNLLNISQRNTLSDNKLKILRVISNEWLNRLEVEIDSKKQFQRERIKSLGSPVTKSSGVYISKNKRIYLRSGNHFEEQFGNNWSRDFFSAFRHGGRYFSSFMTKLYGRAVTLKEFKAKTNKYQILNVRGNYYYSYYSQIGDFGILLMIDLDKTDLKMTLNHYLNNLVRNDKRLERSTQDSFVWSDQEIFLSEKTNYGLRFIPRRSGWIAFLSAKWVSHILFILFIVFLIGLGGYQILSLRLEFRVLVFIAICFISISMVYRLQYNNNELVELNLQENTERSIANKLCKDFYINYKKTINNLLKRLDITNSINLEMPLASISISANRSGQTNFVDNIGEPIVLKILSEILRRYHLTRKGFDPDKISLSDEISNRLAINLPTSKGLAVPYLMSYALKQLRNITPGKEGQRYLQFSMSGDEFILLIPGERMFTSDVIHMVCVKRNDLIKYVAKINDWKSRKVALINLKNMQAIFQNFQPRWTQSKIEKFLLNRHLPSTLRDDLDTKIFYLKWDQILLLMTTSKTLKKKDNRRDAIVSVLCLMLGFISIFLLRNGLFNWLAHSITVFNTYRLRKEIISINHEWFRNEGYEFNNVAEEFVKNIDSRNTQELKVSPAFEELVLHKRDTVASIALLEVAYSGLQKDNLAKLTKVIMAELQRFKGFQLDAGAQFIKLYFPLDIDKNGIQNAAETGLAICQFFKDIENCEFYAVLRTGSFELNFAREYGLQYPIIEIKEIDVEEKPRQPVFNDLIIDKPSYQKLLGLYDLEHIKENFYHFNKDNSEG